MQNLEKVMTDPQGGFVNVIPTKDNVDYTRVYSITDASLLDNFVFLKTNREVSEKNIAKIEKQIKDEEHGAMFIPPILVDINTMTIIDGQNRFTAFKKSMGKGISTEMKVMYVDVDGDYADTLVKLLQDGKNWNKDDYFHRAIANGNAACKEIEKWCMNHSELCMDKSGLNQTYAMCFIYGKRVDKEVKDLTLTINKKQLEFSEQIYKEVLAMFKAMKYKKANFIGGMVPSWYELRKDKNNSLNFFIDDMGMDFICNNLYDELHAFQPTSKKSEWDYKFGQIVQNIYKKYQQQKKNSLSVALA